MYRKFDVMGNLFLYSVLFNATKDSRCVAEFDVTVFSSIEKYTIQKKTLHHIKLAIHAWSTKCG
jgi:hypothetical protein